MVKPNVHTFVDKARVEDAIRRAEQRTDAPITVSIAAHAGGDVREMAHRAQHRHGLTRAPNRNAVHFFVVPSRREFAVVGDAGAHERLGQSVWDSVAATVQKHFRDGDPTAGLVAGIEEIAVHLSRVFPRERSAAE